MCGVPVPFIRFLFPVKLEEVFMLRVFSNNKDVVVGRKIFYETNLRFIYMIPNVPVFNESHFHSLTNLS